MSATLQDPTVEEILCRLLRRLALIGFHLGVDEPLADRKPLPRDGLLREALDELVTDSIHEVGCVLNALPLKAQSLRLKGGAQ